MNLRRLVRSRSQALSLLDVGKRENLESSFVGGLDGWSHRLVFLGNSLVSLSGSLQQSI